MEREPRIYRWKRIEKRTVRCVFCRQAIPLNDALKVHNSVCRLCRMEISELSWRTVYDRDQRVGNIPENLRAAYKL